MKRVDRCLNAGSATVGLCGAFPVWDVGSPPGKVPADLKLGYQENLLVQRAVQLSAFWMFLWFTKT